MQLNQLLYERFKLLVGEANLFPSRARPLRDHSRLLAVEEF